MNRILQTITGELHNQSVRFVFPSETAAARWARKICGLPGVRSVARNRFIAWDRFKEEALRAEMRDREPVSGVVRELFASALAEKNAEERFFRALIPRDFAEDGGIFARSIAKILPSLALWEARSRNRSGYAYDDEDRDLLTLKKAYTRFLEAHKLFEPSWQKAPLGDRERGYRIFFPEIIEDYAEYQGLLESETPRIRIIHAEKTARGNLFFYHSARAEIRALILEIRRLHNQGIPYEEMAVTVPGLESMEPYLLRDLSLYDIPFCRRAGKSLGDYGIGRLFSLIGNCAARDFSFNALKSLVLDGYIPWKEGEKNKALINFGIEHNCVSSYSGGGGTGGGTVDIWEEAFKYSAGDGGLGTYYGDLKKNIRAMAEANSFKEIRNRYFAFRQLLDPEGLSPGEDAALARCVEELSALIQLEEDYPDLTPASPFDFYIALLRDKRYVPAEEDRGVNIFPYRVAAAAPFACHFLLNASQDAAAVLYQPLKFLRRDKRKLLDLPDTDVSPYFLGIYQAEESAETFVRISGAEQTFSGWAIPHSFFAGADAAGNAAGNAAGETAGDAAGETAGIDTAGEAEPPDPFSAERAWWAGGGGFPEILFSAQKRGFERWSAMLGGGGFSFLAEPFPGQSPGAELLRNRVAEKKRPAGSAELSVSATDLTEFFTCPAFWLFKRIFGLKPYSLEAALLDDESLGLLYHRILEKLFALIRKEDRRFDASHLETYYRWAEECTGEIVRKDPAFKGPLAVPLAAAQSRAIAKKLRALLRAEGKYFNGYTVAETEGWIEFTKDAVRFRGKIDRVSAAPGGGPVIIDYKTGKTPSRKNCMVSEDTELRDFQMPMYVKLYEEKTRVPVGGAYFFNINKHDPAVIIGRLPGKRNSCTREAYQPTMDALEEYVRRHDRELGALDFAPKGFVPCNSCDYRYICRTAYSLNREETQKKRVLPDPGVPDALDEEEDDQF
jgi:hypothetical protein